MALLLAATVISGILGDYIEAVLVALVMILNVAIGLIQEGKAERAAAAINAMLAASATVLRDGVQQTVDAAKLVKGDIVLLAGGDSVPADIRLLQVSHLEVSLGSTVPRMFRLKRRLHLFTQVSHRFCSLDHGTALSLGVATGLFLTLVAHTLICRLRKPPSPARPTL